MAHVSNLVTASGLIKLPTDSPDDPKNIASIDIGSHTARLMIARRSDSAGLFKSLFRKRAYISLAEGFGNHERENISPEAIERTVHVLGDFVFTAKRYGVEKILAVSTGVVRKALNREHFLNIINNRTGIDVEVISSEKEAQLTLKGVLHALEFEEKDSVFFDLGGGTTEFIYRQKDFTEVRSVPLGAMVLTQRFFNSDPPRENEIKKLAKYTDQNLEKTLLRTKFAGNIERLVGSGGTVTTLAAMVKHIRVKDIKPESLNGLILERRQIEDLFDKMKVLSVSARSRLPGLDRDRAGLILAGTIAVIRILYFLNCLYVTISCSDILEGIIISHLQGVEDE